MDFMTTYAAATQVVKTLRDLASVGKALDTAELRLKIADLSETMADLKLAHIEAKDDLANAKGEIERLKKLTQRKAELVEYKGYSYDKGKEGKPQGDAYCSVCMEKDALLIHLTRAKGSTAGMCPNCRAIHNVERFAYGD
jgi:hypothetical protein